MAKRPEEMTAGEINKALDSLEKKISGIVSDLIAEGRGDESYSETAAKSDPLSQMYLSANNFASDLRREISARYGPGAPRRLPRGFNKRR